MELQFTGSFLLKFIYNSIRSSHKNKEYFQILQHEIFNVNKFFWTSYKDKSS